MKIVLTGGGTAGHVNPALAIAEIFEKNCHSAAIAFIGTPSGMEHRLVTEAGYPFYPIEAMGLSRSLSLKNLRALYLAAVGPRRARALLQSLSPDLVVGTGGYVSWPILSAAADLGIPCALHESNAVPGLTVRRLAGRVDTVLLNLAVTAEALPRAKSTVHVGNPLRSGFATLTREAAREELGIPRTARLTVSFGGSLGAEAINRAVLTLWKNYTIKEPSVYHIHGCGTRYGQAFRAAVESELPPLPERIRYSAYLEKMPYLMAAADLLICRAGAMTISEAARAGRASILIPSPNVAGDHQTKNALAFAARGAAVLFREGELAEGALIGQVSRILENDGVRRDMEERVKELDVPDANKRIYTALMALVQRK